ncbi:MAG: endonuclease/exonuclease/phosphatase family protein [Acidimicrobiia bacterium]
MTDLTLVAFNAHAGVHGRRRLAGQRFDLAGALRAFDADVIVIPEAYRPDRGPDPIAETAATIGELYEFVLGRERLDPWPHLVRRGPGTGHRSLAVITRLPTRRVGDLSVGRVVGDPARARAALHLELDVDGRPLQLVAVHLTSRLPHGPPIQLSRLRRLLPEPPPPAVVAGDFNFWGPPVRALLPGWRRAVVGRTWPARRPHSQIDHVLVRGGVTAVSGEVLPDVGSDHRPVRVRLRLSS